MGIFSKKPKNDMMEEKLLQAQLVTTRYDNLISLLKGEVSSGAKDNKEVKIVFSDEREVTLWVSNDAIVSIFDSAEKIVFKEFLFWFTIPEERKLEVLKKFEVLHPEMLGDFKESFPELYGSMNDSLRDSSVRNLLWLEDNFKAYESVTTEIVSSSRIPFDEIYSVCKVDSIHQKLEETRAEIANMEKLLGVYGVAKDSVVIKQSNTYEASTSLERFVLAAAKAESNLLELIDFGDGFSSEGILNTALLLKEQGAIEVTVLEELNALPVVLEAKRKHDNVFVATDMGRPIEKLVEEVFELSDWADAVGTYANNNKNLETMVDSLEDDLIEQLAAHDYPAFDAMDESMQHVINNELIEREAHNKLRATILEEIKKNVLFKEGALEQQLIAAIDEKLDGIAKATVSFELQYPEEPPTSDFEIPREELEFEYKDAVIDMDDDGNHFVREATEHDTEPTHVEENFYARLRTANVEHAKEEDEAIAPSTEKSIPAIFLKLAHEKGLDASLFMS